MSNPSDKDWSMRLAILHDTMNKHWIKAFDASIKYYEHQLKETGFGRDWYEELQAELEILKQMRRDCDLDLSSIVGVFIRQWALGEDLAITDYSVIEERWRNIVGRINAGTFWETL